MSINDTFLLELRPSQIDRRGVGVFAVTRIKKGTRILEGIHEKDYKDMVSWKKFKSFPKEVQKKINSFCIGTPKGFIPPENSDFNILSIEWYLNHSCDGNVGFDKNGDFIVIRNVRKNEELAYDYALAESNPQFKMSCTCISRKCRKIITGNDWKNVNPSLSRYMLPQLKKLWVKRHSLKD